MLRCMYCGESDMHVPHGQSNYNGDKNNGITVNFIKPNKFQYGVLKAVRDMTDEMNLLKSPDHSYSLATFFTK